MKYLLLMVLAMIAANASAQLEIGIKDVMSHGGDSVKICSDVFGGRYLQDPKDSTTYLNVGGAFPDALLTVEFGPGVRRQFNNDPEDFYDGLEVCITGKIEIAGGKAFIRLYDKKQMYNNQ